MSLLPNMILIAGLLAIILVVVMPVLTWVSRQDERKRRYEHEQKLRAIEVGRPLSSDETPWWYPPRLAATLATVVPISIFGLTFLAHRASEVPLLAWASAGAVGVAAVVSGVWLAAYHASMYRGEAPAPYKASNVDKPLIVDSDAYDVVSRRG